MNHHFRTIICRLNTTRAQHYAPNFVSHKHSNLQLKEILTPILGWGGLNINVDQGKKARWVDAREIKKRKAFWALAILLG
jgi:hypothetical protein